MLLRFFETLAETVGTLNRKLPVLSHQHECVPAHIEQGAEMSVLSAGKNRAGFVLANVGPWDKQNCLCESS